MAGRKSGQSTRYPSLPSSAPSTWTDENCAASDGKQFGPCRINDGVVLQERAGEAVLLAVAFDVGVVGPDGENDLTVMVAVGGP